MPECRLCVGDESIAQGPLSRGGVKRPLGSQLNSGGTAWPLCGEGVKTSNVQLSLERQAAWVASALRREWACFATLLFNSVVGGAVLMCPVAMGIREYRQSRCAMVIQAPIQRQPCCYGLSLIEHCVFAFWFT